MEHQQLVITAVLIVLLLQGSPAETTRRLSVLVGTNVTLGCFFKDRLEQLELSVFTVEWNMVDEHDKKNNVYTFEDGKAHMKRAGAVVDKTQFLQSNASLQLRNVTVGDQGLYTCRIITPVVHIETIRLEVLARPSVFLPEKVAVMEGQEKTIQCNITGFYPEKLAVTWHIGNGSYTVLAGVSHLLRVCTNVAIRNADGTYSRQSGITLHSSVVKEGGTNIICKVEHDTFSQSCNKSVTLTVKDLPYSSSASWTVASAFVFGMVILIFGFVALAIVQMSEGPPSVSDITPSIVSAGVKTQLMCTIQGQGRQVLRVRWFRFRSSEPNAKNESAPLLDSEELQGSLKSDGRHHTAVLPVCLSVTEDQTKFKCEVICRGKSTSIEITVGVRVEPSLIKISSIPQIPELEKMLMLCCRVENFYPPEVDLEWFRDDGEPVGTITQFGPFSVQNNLYSMWNKIELLMAREDKNVTYTCRIYHSSFPDPSYRDVAYHINTQGRPPDVGYIICDPQGPLLNEECTLHLCIADFSPEDLFVKWTKNGGEDLSGSFNTPPSLNINGLYSMFTFFKFTPTEDDRDAEFMCRVVHSGHSDPEERLFKLSIL